MQGSLPQKIIDCFLRLFLKDSALSTCNFNLKSLKSITKHRSKRLNRSQQWIIGCKDVGLLAKDRPMPQIYSQWQKMSGLANHVCESCGANEDVPRYTSKTARGTDLSFKVRSFSNRNLAWEVSRKCNEVLCKLQWLAALETSLGLSIQDPPEAFQTILHRHEAFPSQRPWKGSKASRDVPNFSPLKSRNCFVLCFFSKKNPRWQSSNQRSVLCQALKIWLSTRLNTQVLNHACFCPSWGSNNTFLFDSFLSLLVSFWSSNTGILPNSYRLSLSVSFSKQLDAIRNSTRPVSSPLDGLHHCINESVASQMLVTKLLQPSSYKA